MKTYIPWLMVFLSFPVGGALALVPFGSVTNSKRGAIGGLIVGVIIGLAQWYALRKIIPGIQMQWILATALGCSIGTSLFYSIGNQGAGYFALFWRGLATGLVIGVAQFFFLRTHLPNSTTWVLIVGGAWALGWMTTKIVGVNLSKGYAVFGASGAFVFQCLTGIALYFLSRSR